MKAPKVGQTIKVELRCGVEITSTVTSVSKVDECGEVTITLADKATIHYFSSRTGEWVADDETNVFFIDITGAMKSAELFTKQDVIKWEVAA